MAYLYVFHQGTGGNGQLWFSRNDHMNWAGDTLVSNVSMSESPCAISWAGGITVFHQGPGDDGQLWYTFSGDGVTWSGGDALVPAIALTGSPSAVVYNGLLYVFHQGQGDDGQLWYTTFDGTNWTADTLIPNVIMSGSPSAVLWKGGITVFHPGANNDGQLWYTFSGDGRTWRGGDALVPVLAMSGSPSAVVYNGLLYVFHQGQSDDGQLWYTTFDGTKWSADTLIPNLIMSGSPSAVLWANGITVFHPGADNDGQLWYTWSSDGVNFGKDTPVSNVGISASPSCIAAVPTPSSGLGSNSNYILYSDCNPLINLSITINVTQDIVCESASGSIIGFGFQLNAYSPPSEMSAWQQYVIACFGSELIGAVDNWPISGANIINDSFNLTSLPSPKVPAGYQLTISLENDQNGNVTGATYVVIDDSGNTLANVPLNLLSIAGVTPAELAPITAFELNLVGPANGESAALSSGAGSITYTASNVLSVLNQEPACTESGYITAETANSFYSTLPPAFSNTFTQSFEVIAGRPMIRKPGKPRPSTRWVRRMGDGGWGPQPHT
jgi:hypothetical protein